MFKYMKHMRPQTSVKHRDNQIKIFQTFLRREKDDIALHSHSVVRHNVRVRLPIAQ